MLHENLNRSKLAFNGSELGQSAKGLLIGLTKRRTSRLRGTDHSVHNQLELDSLSAQHHQEFHKTIPSSLSVGFPFVVLVARSMDVVLRGSR